MSDPKERQAADDKGQKDGARYAESNWTTKITAPQYSPPSGDKAVKESYDSGFKNGKSGGK